MTAEMAFQLLKIYKFKEHKREKKKKKNKINTHVIHFGQNLLYFDAGCIVKRREKKLVN